MGGSSDKSESVDADLLGSEGNSSVGSAGHGLGSWVEEPLLVGLSSS